MTEKYNGYNGWANKPTWLMSLWLFKDEEKYSYLKEVSKGKTVLELAQWLEGYVNQNNPIDSDNMYADLLAWAIELIHFEELAKSIKDD